MSGSDYADRPPTNGTAWRLQSLERRMDKLEQIEPAVLADRINNHTNEFAEIREEIASLRRALYTFAFTIAGAAIVFGIGVLQVVR